MGDNHRSYPYRDPHGDVQFILEKFITETHAKYFMERLLNVHNPADNIAKILFENLLFKTCELPPPNAPDLSTLTVQEKADLDAEMKKLVDTFNSSPLVVRDLFTRCVLENAGVYFEAPAVTLPDAPSEGRILHL